MAKASLLLVFIVGLLSQVSCDDVIALTRSNFDEQTLSGSWMIAFYAPWCGHCKRLEPIWTQFATAAAVQGDVKVGKVDCTVEKELASRFNIKAFPTIKLLYNGKLYDYKKGRTVEDFSAFAKGGYVHAIAQDIPKGNNVDISNIWGGKVI
jgi:protein disulfide-isomerase-like protein